MADQYKPNDASDFRLIPTHLKETFARKMKTEFVLGLIYPIVPTILWFWILMKFYVHRVEPPPEENLVFAIGVLLVFNVFALIGSKYGHPVPKRQK